MHLLMLFICRVMVKSLFILPLQNLCFLVHTAFMTYMKRVFSVGVYVVFVLLLAAGSPEN